MKSVNKENLAMVLHDKIGLSSLVCGTIVSSIFNNIVKLLVQNQSLKLKNFGSFSVRQKQKRPGMNLNTKEVVEIPPRKVIKFTPSRNLKAKLNYLI